MRYKDLATEEKVTEKYTIVQQTGWEMKWQNEMPENGQPDMRLQKCGID